MPTVRPSRDSERAASASAVRAIARSPRAPAIVSMSPVGSAQAITMTKNIVTVRSCAMPPGQSGDHEEDAEHDRRPAACRRVDEPAGGEQDEPRREGEPAEDREADRGGVVGGEGHHDGRDRRERRTRELHMPHFEGAGWRGLLSRRFLARSGSWIHRRDASSLRACANAWRGHHRSAGACRRREIGPIPRAVAREERRLFRPSIAPTATCGSRRRARCRGAAARQPGPRPIPARQAGRRSHGVCTSRPRARRTDAAPRSSSRRGRRRTRRPASRAPGTAHPVPTAAGRAPAHRSAATSRRSRPTRRSRRSR